MIHARSLAIAVGLAGGLVATGLAGCLSPLPPPQLAASGAPLDPVAFFTDGLHSWGVLEGRGGAPSKTFRVESHGARGSDGALALDQTIRWSDGGVDVRRWRLGRTADGRWASRLTDASGPVTIEVRGPLLHIVYPMKSPPGGVMEQRLYLQPDGRTLLNEGQVRLLGVTVARISEVITRDPPPPG